MIVVLNGTVDSIICHQCGKVDLVKNGHSKTGAYRYQCRNCGKTLQPDYSYNACLPAVKEQIDSEQHRCKGCCTKSGYLKKH